MLKVTEHAFKGYSSSAIDNEFVHIEGRPVEGLPVEAQGLIPLPPWGRAHFKEKRGRVRRVRGGGGRRTMLLLLLFEHGEREGCVFN